LVELLHRPPSGGRTRPIPTTREKRAPGATNPAGAFGSSVGSGVSG
jgi:hypothetical protein